MVLLISSQCFILQGICDMTVLMEYGVVILIWWDGWGGGGVKSDAKAGSDINSMCFYYYKGFR